MLKRDFMVVAWCNHHTQTSWIVCLPTSGQTHQHVNSVRHLKTNSDSLFGPSSQWQLESWGVKNSKLKVPVRIVGVEIMLSFTVKFSGAHILFLLTFTKVFYVTHPQQFICALSPRHPTVAVAGVQWSGQFGTQVLWALQQKRWSLLLWWHMCSVNFGSNSMHRW